MNLHDKVVLVTGSSRGIGAAIAQGFAEHGAAIAVNYLSNQDAAQSVVKACEASGGSADAFQGDVTDPEAVAALVDNVTDTFGRVDVLVNNAFRPYVFDPDERKTFWQLQWNDYQQQLDGTLRSCYLMTQAVLPAMKASSSGSIINMSTDLVARPTVAYHDYTTAKSALAGFSRNLAAELGPLGIRVNSVAPGLVYPTEASRYTKETVKDAIVAQTPLRRVARPEDVVGPVLFLASSWSQFMTGQTLYVDGGLVMNP